MKITGFIITTLLVSCITGCTNNQTIRKIDVTKTYPKKQITLQDIAEVSYIPLETNDSFLCSSGPETITANKIIVQEWKTGDVMVFDSKGKALNKFNRKGNGDQEYNNIFNLLYDENADELFINGSAPKILVYNGSGKFLRSLSCKNIPDIHQLFNFDNDNLLCYSRDTITPIILLSKQNGQITHKVEIPFEKKLFTYVKQTINGENVMEGTGFNYAEKANDGFFLSEISSDTIYQLTNKRSLVPVGIREPAVQKMEAPVYLKYGPESKQYAFMYTLNMDLTKKVNRRFLITYLFSDKETGEIFEQEAINSDYPEQKLTVSAFFHGASSVAGTGMMWLTTDMLKDALEQDKLQGKLKEVASNLHEDDNGVVMLIKLKE